MVKGISQEIVVALLRRAGITQKVQSVQAITNKGITNQMAIVVLQNEQRFILRQYQWPWGGVDYDRVRKEKFLHRVLQQHSVPVPVILADVELEGQAAVLMEYVSGEELGDVTNVLSMAERAQAWHSCGQMLRRAHTISYPEGSYGIIVGDQVQTFAEFERGTGPWRFESPTWGHFHVGMIVEFFKQLVTKRLDITVPLNQLSDVLAESLPLLNRTPPTLLHNDTHPWNVLVRSTEDGWRCSAWLDWEYAWVGDPNWDLVRMDLFRKKPIGPTPEAFWEGYGRMPSEPERSIYEMHIFLWMANQYLNGDQHHMPTYEAAMRYVNRFDDAVRSIQRWLKSS